MVSLNLLAYVTKAHTTQRLPGSKYLYIFIYDSTELTNMVRHHTSFMIFNLSEWENDKACMTWIFLGTAPSKIKAELRPEKYIGYCFSYHDWETICMRLSELPMVTEIKTVVTWERRGIKVDNTTRKEHKRIFWV